MAAEGGGGERFEGGGRGGGGGRAESSSCLGIRGRNQKKKKAGFYECQITTGNKLVRFTTLVVTENIPLIFLIFF